MCLKDSTSSSSKVSAAVTVKIASAWCDRHQLIISAGHWSNDKETTRFPVWEAELPLDLCARRIPEKLHFQKGYPKAEAVWAQTALGAQIRSDVHRENVAMFGSCRNKSVVNGSSEFLSAMGFGFRDGKAQVYSCVLTSDGRLRFCESAAEVMHISLSDANQEILFSGEFFIVHEAGRYFVVVTNNSGSYRPDKDRLESARQLFADILGDIDVEACLMDDPRIKQLTTRHRGDPLHMGHSVHHTELTEQRSAAQMKSALVIMGRGHEVGEHRYGQVAQRRVPAQSPQPCYHRIAGHRRSRTWGASPGLVGGSEEPCAQESSSIPPAHPAVGQCSAYALGQPASGPAMADLKSQSSIPVVYQDPFALTSSAQNSQKNVTATQPRVMILRQLNGSAVTVFGQRPSASVH
eukprot:gnl/MRDRNA2_/MRDRNA2_94332_c0_seq1.p1 gnl/MRDRNA2_/MRDRNA2_94332_c0~~gnl/MRDRNA2_/MRDRNA2_94332_c0_seq1.p1  ORF type:complete len:437 (+),score=53.45 gnl/MRDRNA2_/MRDRNA2_94332_c0_seq1:92-1312(+)